MLLFCKIENIRWLIPNELYRDTISSSINKATSILQLNLNFCLDRNYIMMHELCYLFTFLFCVFFLITFHACAAIASPCRQMWLWILHTLSMLSIQKGRQQWFSLSLEPGGESSRHQECEAAWISCAGLGQPLWVDTAPWADTVPTPSIQVIICAELKGSLFVRREPREAGRVRSSISH